MVLTPLVSWEATADASPPFAGWPQAMTLPSSRRAAKAEWSTKWTPMVKMRVTLGPDGIGLGVIERLFDCITPQEITLPSALMAAKAWEEAVMSMMSLLENGREVAGMPSSWKPKYTLFQTFLDTLLYLIWLK